MDSSTLARIEADINHLSLAEQTLLSLAQRLPKTLRLLSLQDPPDVARRPSEAVNHCPM